MKNRTLKNILLTKWKWHTWGGYYTEWDQGLMRDRKRWHKRLKDWWQTKTWQCFSRGVLHQSQHHVLTSSRTFIFSLNSDKMNKMIFEFIILFRALIFHKYLCSNFIHRWQYIYMKWHFTWILHHKTTNYIVHLSCLHCQLFNMIGSVITPISGSFLSFWMLSAIVHYSKSHKTNHTSNQENMYERYEQIVHSLF